MTVVFQIPFLIIPNEYDATKSSDKHTDWVNFTKHSSYVFPPAATYIFASIDYKITNGFSFDWKIAYLLGRNSFHQTFLESIGIVFCLFFLFILFCCFSKVTCSACLTVVECVAIEVKKKWDLTSKLISFEFLLDCRFCLLIFRINFKL